MPSSGFQALILCGPGISLNTFTSSSEDLPKALVPIANRAMVWYPLDWCYRMGITSKSHRVLCTCNAFFGLKFDRKEMIAMPEIGLVRQPESGAELASYELGDIYHVSC